MKRSISMLMCTFFVLCCIATTETAKNVEENTPSAPNYAADVSWVVKATALDKTVDVFYVYPTIYSAESPRNMNIHEKALRASTQHLMVTQAGAYSETANLFAPFYRQMTIAELDPETDMFQNPYFKIGAEDVERAFDYYLEKLNPDRPFILAGHSQGAMVLIHLMRKHFNDPALQKRLIAAYLIGYSVTHDDLEKYPWIKLAQGADDTGVVITYNTQSPEATGSPVLTPGAVCINPLSWTTTEEAADKSLNLGAVFFNEKTSAIEREIPQYIGAQIDLKKGALIVTPPEALELGHFPEGVYHRFDYSFFYRNLQQNAAQRVKAYLEKAGK